MSWTIVLVLVASIVLLAALGIINPVFSVALKGLFSVAVLAAFAFMLYKRKRTIARQHAMQRAHVSQNAHQPTRE